MSEEKLCISCKWFRVKIEGHRWSEWTPGSPSYIGCAASCKPGDTKNHWGLDPGNPDDAYLALEDKKKHIVKADVTDYYRKMLKTAETCEDYTDLRNE